MDGILNVNKPQGMTSFGVVALMRRMSGERRIGHAGTLDPDATGVLPVCLGQATRVVEFLMDCSKTYRAEIELGVTTDTYDIGGTVVARGDPSGIDRGQFESTLDSFRGRILQTPPMYSAVKHQGRPLYELARQGITIDRQPRQVDIHRLGVTVWQPPVVTVEVTCSKGTYIRSLAHDIGQMLGCGATLRSLIRLRCGTFRIEDAVPLPELERAFGEGYWEQLVQPMDTVLSDWLPVSVGEDTAQAIRHGRSVELENGPGGDPEGWWDEGATARCRVYAPDGRLLSLMRLNPVSRQWQPLKVFR